MAKDKDKKDKKPRVPKKIAGVKVPKQLRKTANQALELSEIPAVREFALAALTAAAAALADDKGKGGESDGGRKGPTRGRKAPESANLTDAVIAAALDGARRLLDGIESPPADAARKRRRSVPAAESGAE